MDDSERLQIVAAEQRVLGMMVSALIATHPRPAALREFVQQATLEWTDDLAVQEQRHDAPLFHATLRRKLAFFAEVLDRVAGQPPAE